MKLACGLLAIALLAATAAAAQPISVRDDAKATVTLTRPVQRIVSLAPSATEIVFAAGAGAKVVGVVSSSDYPDAVRSLPQVGDAQSLDLERIIALRPDLVVTWPYTVPAQLAPLRQRRIPIFVIDPASVEGIATAIERIGMLANTERVAAPAGQRIRQRYRALVERFRGRASIRVFYEVWGEPLVTLGGGHIVSHAIETCGGANVFAPSGTPAPTVGVEEVLAAAPEAIVIGVDDGRPSQWMDAWRRWPSLPAVGYDNVFSVNADHLHRPGPRFIEGVEELCRALDRAREHRSAGARTRAR